MTKDIRDVWPQFDALIVQTECAATKALIAAIRLQTELLDLHLSQIEVNTAYPMQNDLRRSVFGE